MKNIKMIDAKLIEKAKTASPEITNIDKSWRQYVETIKSNIFKLPFQGQYNALVEDESILIEGYSGPLLIDRVTGDRSTYLLTKPIRSNSFNIYGVWDKRAQFDYFTSKPVLGFHYFGIESSGIRKMCTGDLEYVNPVDLNSLKEISLRIINSLKVIYLGSLGDVFVPPEYDQLKEILKSDRSIKDKISTLLSEEWIKEIL